MKALNGPIPGQSLTTEPKAYPWERPPEITDPEEAIQMHLTRLAEPEMMKGILHLIEIEDMDIYTITKGILRGAVANGIHSIDVGLLVGPVIHEFIKQNAKAVGINAEDGFVDKVAQEEERRSVQAARAKKQIAQMKGLPRAVPKEAPAPAPSPAPQRGLMSRGGM